MAEYSKINQRAVLNNLSNDARISVEAASNKVPKLNLNTTPSFNIPDPDYMPNTTILRNIRKVLLILY